MWETSCIVGSELKTQFPSSARKTRPQNSLTTHEGAVRPRSRKDISYRILRASAHIPKVAHYQEFQQKMQAMRVRQEQVSNIPIKPHANYNPFELERNPPPPRLCLNQTSRLSITYNPSDPFAKPNICLRRQHNSHYSFIWGTFEPLYTRENELVQAWRREF